MTNDDRYFNLAEEIDERDDIDVTGWEADFLEGLIRIREDGQPLTVRQRAKIEEMAERYL